MSLTMRTVCNAIVGFSALLVLFACSDRSSGGAIASPDAPQASAGGQADVTPLSLLSPVRIDTYSDREVVVSDAYQEAVHLIDKETLEVLQSIRIMGEPGGVAVLGEGVLVGNLTTGAVEYYPLSGDAHTTFATGIERPTSIGISATGDRVFVLDGATKVVLVFDEEGVRLDDIPGSDEATALIQPSALMVHPPDDKLFISDFGDPGNSISASVKVYSRDGVFLREISGQGENVGGWFKPEYVNGFSRPQGVAVVDGVLYVADSLLGQVLAFDSESGAFIASLGTFGEGVGKLYLPLDVTVNGTTGDLIVTSNGTASLVVLSPGGTP